MIMRLRKHKIQLACFVFVAAASILNVLLVRWSILKENSIALDSISSFSTIEANDKHHMNAIPNSKDADGPDADPSARNTVRVPKATAATTDFINTLRVIPYMESPKERDYIRQIHALSPVSTSPEKKSVISFSLYGNNPKYVQGAIENAKLRDTYFPGWTLRYYVLPSFPAEKIKELKELGAEVEHPPDELSDETSGMFWRFLAADDPQVERFIFRDTDSRLNARDRFAIEEWIKSGKPCHVIRDHPYHYLLMNGGLWGGNRGFLKNNTMIDLIRDFKKNKKCRHVWGCDNKFLEYDLWPLIKDDQISYDSYYCKSNPNSVAFPTPRDPNYQFVGQAFDGDGNSIKEHLEKLKKEAVVAECSGSTENDALK